MRIEPEHLYINPPGSYLAVPVLRAGEELLLVCIAAAAEAPLPTPPPPYQLPQLAEMEREVETARNEQLATLKELELSREEHRVATEEALAINEEYQSTNEELQSLNEELTALNSQLQETPERQRTLGDDLQNILYSTDVATLFLDLDLRIDEVYILAHFHVNRLSAG